MELYWDTATIRVCGKNYSYSHRCIACGERLGNHYFLPSQTHTQDRQLSCVHPTDTRMVFTPIPYDMLLPSGV